MRGIDESAIDESNGCRVEWQINGNEGKRREGATRVSTSRTHWQYSAIRKKLRWKSFLQLSHLLLDGLMSWPHFLFCLDLSFFSSFSLFSSLSFATPRVPHPCDPTTSSHVEEGS